MLVSELIEVSEIKSSDLDELIVELQEIRKKHGVGLTLQIDHDYRLFVSGVRMRPMTKQERLAYDLKKTIERVFP